MPLSPEARAKVQLTADNLQIPLYICEDGHPYQQSRIPPGMKVIEIIIPDPKAAPQTNHGHEAPPSEPPASG